MKASEQWKRYAQLLSKQASLAPDAAVACALFDASNAAEALATVLDTEEKEAAKEMAEIRRSMEPSWMGGGHR